jgi:predicted helicase
LKIKLKGRHFETTEVIKAESQAMLNTLTEHGFQAAFKEMAEALGTVHTRGRGLIRGFGGDGGQ